MNICGIFFDECKYKKQNEITFSFFNNASESFETKYSLKDVMNKLGCFKYLPKDYKINKNVRSIIACDNDSAKQLLKDLRNEYN